MGMYDGPNALAAERVCAEHSFRETTARRTASGAIARPEAIAGPEADTVRTPAAVRTETGDQATALVETASVGHGIGRLAKKAWASVTGRWTSPGTASEGSDK